MKKLTTLLKEVIEEGEFEGYIIIITDDDTQGNLSLLTEGQWKHSGEKDYWLRKERERNLWHVHITHEKHKRTKTKQVAWTELGKRKDKKTFDVNFKGMETAKRIARNALDLDADFILEAVSEAEPGSLLLESVESIGKKLDVYVFSI